MDEQGESLGKGRVRMRAWRRVPAVLLGVALAATVLALSGCGCGDDTGDTDTEATQQSEDGTPVRVFFVGRGEKAVAVTRYVAETEDLPSAAMEELLAGPSSDETEAQPALHSAIPTDTEFLGVTVADGTATLNMSYEYQAGGGTFWMTTRLAQVVYTLTEFDTVDRVLFQIDGNTVGVFSGEGIVLDGPQTREHFDELLPIAE